MTRQLDNGELEPPIEGVVDARAVFDAIAAVDVGEIIERGLKLHLLSLRDRLTCRTLSRLWWSDARDMLAAALTKGSVSREQLALCGEKGLCRLQHAAAQTRCDNGRRLQQ